MEKKITYFENPGQENTAQAISLAVDYAKENSIKKIIIASSTGESALELRKKASDLEIIDVVYSEAVSYKDTLRKFHENQKILEKNNIKVVRCTHSFSGVEKCVAQRYKGVSVNALIADVLKLFSEGIKVAVEAAMMAADVGAVKKEPVLVLGGTSHGVDSCLLVEPSTTSNFFEFSILEIICMPRFGGLAHG